MQKSNRNGLGVAVLRDGIITVAALLFCLFILKDWPSPFVWILGIGVLVCFYLCVMWRPAAIRNTFLFLGFFLTPLFLAEFALYLFGSGPELHTEFTPYGSSYEPRGALGYGPRANTSIQAKHWVNGEPDYSVTYNIGPHGWRTGPLHETDGDCLLFMGGSFTFGEGINGEESLPAQVAEQLNGKYAVRNFAYSGYGPHQILAALEHGVVTHAAQCMPHRIIYSALVPHIGRVIGLATWDETGPAYQLNADGEPESTGSFSQVGGIRVKLVKQLTKSYLYNRLFPSRLPGPYTDEEIAMATAVIDRARKIAQNQFPEAQFHVLLWDPRLHGNPRTEDYEALDAALQKRGIPVHKIDAGVLPGDLDQYHVSKIDLHPNGAANSRIAALVVKEVVGE